MGNRCSCCLFTQQTSSDSDSITKRSDVAEDGQPKFLAAYKKAEKKISKATSVELQRQQSHYFKKNKVFQPPSQNNQTPLLTFDKKKIVKKKKGEEHTSYYNRIRQKIKPQINAAKCNQEDFSSVNSRGEYYKDVQKSSDQNSQNQENNNDISFRFEKNQHNLSFQYPTVPIAIENEYRTQKNTEIKRQKKTTQHIEKLYSLAESTNQPSQLLDCYTQLAYYKFQQKDLDSSQKFLIKALNLPSMNQQNSDKKISNVQKKIKLFVLAGSVYILRDKAQLGLDYLLKAIKIQSTDNKKSQSMNLIECYYWLGQAYSKLSKQAQSKQYFNKAYKLYIKYQVKEPKLMASICFNLGKAYNSLEEYAEADRFYSRGLKEAQSSGDVGSYVQILLKTAQNKFNMDQYNSSLTKFKTIFQLIKKFEWNSQIIQDQAKKSLGIIEQKLQKMILPLNELKILVNLCEQICPQMQELKPLKDKVRKPLVNK